jgi:CBS domain-containing protein
MKVQDFMTAKVVSVSPDHSVWHAAKIMLRHGVSGLPVIDDEGKLCGILTEGDLMRRAELGNLHAHHKSHPEGRAEHAQRLAKGHAWCVHDAMTRPVHTVDSGTALGAAASQMDKYRVRRLPVVDAGKVVGVLSRHDVLKALASFNPPRDRPADKAVRLQVQTRLKTIPPFGIQICWLR